MIFTSQDDVCQHDSPRLILWIKWYVYVGKTLSDACDELQAQSLHCLLGRCREVLPSLRLLSSCPPRKLLTLPGPAFLRRSLSFTSSNYFQFSRISSLRSRQF